MAAALLAISANAAAQTQLTPYQPGTTAEGTVYFLPKTEVRVVIQLEKTTATPGDFYKYASRYLRLNDVIKENTVTYKLNTIRLYTAGTPDKSKAYAVKVNAKSTATNMELSDEGVLLAINDETRQQTEPALFLPAPKPKTTNPRNFLGQEILAAGSTAKMAELTAKEIYDIRESVNELTRGEADYMPKDGEQLRLMLAKLAEQDAALTGMFCGTTTKDTIEHCITICPDKEINGEILFRLSKHLGLVDADDLSGAPYYISIKDMKSLPEIVEDPKAAKKKKKYESGIFVNVPGKVLVTISDSTQPLLSQEINTAQFGRTELLGAELFNRKYITHLTLNPITGAVDKFESEEVGK